jgi:hypothetical protein
MRLRGDEQVSSIALVAESEEPVEGGETVTEPVPEGVEDSAGENGNLQ